MCERERVASCRVVSCRAVLCCVRAVGGGSCQGVAGYGWRGQEEDAQPSMGREGAGRQGE